MAWHKRRFVGLKVPMAIELIDGRVTTLRPLQLDDYSFVMTAGGIMIGKGELAPSV